MLDEAKTLSNKIGIARALGRGAVAIVPAFDRAQIMELRLWREP